MPELTTTPAGAAAKLPRHIAAIMDGNGRWARLRGLPRSAGHAAGAETFRRIATYCRDLGLEHFTVYAFSTENWKRSADEVDAIMGLLKKYLLESIEKMERDRIRLKILGDTSALSGELRELIDATDAIARRLSGCFQANVCLNYGGRDEIVRAVKRFCGEHPAGELTERALSDSLEISCFGKAPTPNWCSRTSSGRISPRRISTPPLRNSRAETGATEE